MQLSGAQRGAGLLLCTGGCVALLAARATKQGPPRRRFSGARVASMSQTLSASPLAAVTTASSGGAVTREELGRCTWTLLHTLAAQFPEQPTKQQQRDACELVMILSRLFPCRECAAHFAELVRADPPSSRSRADLSAWMCRAHNTVSARLGKPAFNCARADARWGLVRCVDDACGSETVTTRS